MLMLMTTGCEPDSASPADNTINPQTYAEQQLQALKDFHALVVNRNGGGVDFRSSTTYTVTEAKQNIEALANVSFSRGMTDAAAVSTQRDSFLVPITNGEIDGDDVVDGYFAAHARLLVHYESIADPNKQVLATVLQVGAVAAGDLKFYIRTEIGEGSASVVTDDCENEFTKGYWAGPPLTFETGVCSSPFGSVGPSTGNADLRLDRAVDQEIRNRNTHITGLSTFAGWIGIEEIGRLPVAGLPNEPSFIDPLQYPNDDDEIPGDMVRDNLVYEAEVNGNQGVYCFEPSDMNFYLCNYIDLSYSVTPVSGKTLMSIDIRLSNGGCECNFFFHHIKRTWGIPVYVSDGPGYNNNCCRPDDGAYIPDLGDVTLAP